MTSLFYERALLWIVLLPLAGALLNGTLGIYGHGVSKKLVGQLGTATVAGSFVLSVLVFLRLVSMSNQGAVPLVENHLYDWFTVHTASAHVPVRVAFVADALSGIMLLVVTGIGTLIHVYSQEYMADDPSFPRFFAYLNLFTASMLILVLGSSLPVLFVGWEGVGLCSYLLIGFWHKTPAYAAAGRKAFVVNRIGDFGFLIGTFILFTAVRSFEFSDIAERADLLTQSYTLFRSPIGMTATIAALFFFLGCAGKSAQIPLYIWLPDAMAGPTPVSALIHAATMVTAGVYLCCRMSAVFVASPTAMAVVAVVGALTALLAASIALVQNEMKKILAYSTVSQLGFMFAAVGSGAFAAGIFHVFTHAFFKACLFLGAGAVMHAVHAHGDADVRKLGGLRSKLPVVHGTFLVSCLAIAGIPGLSGFFSKDEILLGTLSGQGFFSAAAESLQSTLAHSGSYPWPRVVGAAQALLLSNVSWFVFLVLVVAAAMTAFYMFRLYFLTFSGDYRSASAGHGGDEEGADGHGAYDPHPHAPGDAIRYTLSTLAVGAVAAGWLGLPHAWHLPNLWSDWLHDGLATVSASHGVSVALSAAHAGSGHAPGGAGVFGLSVEMFAMLSGTAAAVGGAALAWVLFADGKGVPGTHPPRGFASVLWNKWWVDEFYGRTIVRGTEVLAVVSASVDRFVVDGVLARLSSGLVWLSGWAISRLQTGQVHGYAMGMVLGTLGVFWWFSYPQGSLEAEVSETNSTISWKASPGFGYQYAWQGEVFDTAAACTGVICETRVQPSAYQDLVVSLRRAPRFRDERVTPVVIPLSEKPVPLPLHLADEPSSPPMAPKRSRAVMISAGYVVWIAGHSSALHAGQRQWVLDDTVAPSLRRMGSQHPRVLLSDRGVILDAGGADVEQVAGATRAGETLLFAGGGSMLVGGVRLTIDRVAVVDPNGATLIAQRGPTTETSFLRPGELFRDGGFVATVGAQIEGAVDVTTVFGTTRRLVRSVVVEPAERQARDAPAAGGHVLGAGVGHRLEGPDLLAGVAARSEMP